MKRKVTTRVVTGLTVATLAVGLGACNKDKSTGAIGGMGGLGGPAPSLSTPTGSHDLGLGSGSGSGSGSGGSSTPADVPTTLSLPTNDPTTSAEPDGMGGGGGAPTSEPLGQGGAGEPDEATVAPELQAAGVIPPGAKLAPNNSTYRSDMSVAQTFTGTTQQATIDFLKGKGWTEDPSMGSTSGRWMRKSGKRVVISDGFGGVSIQYFLT